MSSYDNSMQCEIHTKYNTNNMLILHVKEKRTFLYEMYPLWGPDERQVIYPPGI